MGRVPRARAARPQPRRSGRDQDQEQGHISEDEEDAVAVAEAEIAGDGAGLRSFAERADAAQDVGPPAALHLGRHKIFPGQQFKGGLGPPVRTLGLRVPETAVGVGVSGPSACVRMFQTLEKRAISRWKMR